jgi:hypothetical protein
MREHIGPKFIASVSIAQRPITREDGNQSTDDFAQIDYELDLSEIPPSGLTMSRFVPGICCVHRWLFVRPEMEFDPDRELVEQRCSKCRARCLRDPSTHEMVTYSADVHVPEIDGGLGLPEELSVAPEQSRFEQSF